MEDLLVCKIHMALGDWNDIVEVIGSAHMMMDLLALGVAQGGEENVFDLGSHRQTAQSFHTLVSYSEASKVHRLPVHAHKKGVNTLESLDACKVKWDQNLLWEEFYVETLVG